jgi:hypothetical protein
MKQADEDYTIVVGEETVVLLESFEVRGEQVIVKLHPTFLKQLHAHAEVEDEEFFHGVVNVTKQTYSKAAATLILFAIGQYFDIDRDTLVETARQYGLEYETGEFEREQIEKGADLW